MKATGQAAEEVRHPTDQALPATELPEIRGYQTEGTQIEENRIGEKTLIHMFPQQVDERKGHELVLRVATADDHEVQSTEAAKTAILLD